MALVLRRFVWSRNGNSLDFFPNLKLQWFLWINYIFIGLKRYAIIWTFICTTGKHRFQALLQLCLSILHCSQDNNYQTFLLIVILLQAFSFIFIGFMNPNNSIISWSPVALYITATTLPGAGTGCYPSLGTLFPPKDSKIMILCIVSDFLDIWWRQDQLD